MGRHVGPKTFLISLLPLSQDISRMERDLDDLESQIQAQQQSVETKEAAMEKIRDQIAQVVSRHSFSFENLSVETRPVSLIQ